MGYTTCFTGHRPKGLPCGYNEENSSCKRIKNLLYKLTFGIICKKDVSHFITGMAEGIDIWAAETVLRIKEHTFSNITLEAAIPCRTQTSGWNVKSRDRYNRILKKCDQVTFMQEKYTYDCMMKRNKYMVDSSDYVIAVWNGRPSGTANTIRYAASKNKPIYYVDLRDFKMKAI